MKRKLESTFGDRVARVVLDQYDRLGKTGKPQGKEWTILAGIVACTKTSTNDVIKVITIATGNKCVGASGMSVSGMVVNDCHAEVLARRSLIHCITKQLAKGDCMDWLLAPNSGGPDDSAPLCLRNDVTLHLYISDAPCGDASVITDLDRSLNEHVVAGRNVRDGASAKVGRVTGAKVVHDTSSSLLQGDEQLAPSGCVETVEEIRQQAIGALRTKSGRSDLRPEDRTLSMSCSDKILMWNLSGLGGSLLSRLVSGLYLTSVVVGGDSTLPTIDGIALSVTQVEASVHRAVQGRIPKEISHDRQVQVYVASQSFFRFSRQQRIRERNAAEPIAAPKQDYPGIGVSRVPSKRSLKPKKIPSSGTALNWHIGDESEDNGKAEVLASALGVKLGVKKSKLPDVLPKVASRLSQRKLAENCVLAFTTVAPSLLERLKDTKREWDYTELKEEVGAAYRRVRNQIRNKEHQVNTGFVNLNDWVVCPPHLKSNFVVQL